MPDPSKEVVEACLALGFAGAGICAAAPSAHAGEVRRWLQDGGHGTMSWMEEWLEQRVDVRSLIPQRTVRSVVMVADQYARRTGDDEEHSPGAGRIARYARGRDYHHVIRKRLHTLADNLRAQFPAEAFRVFVDTGPVLEREQAARAGLGFVGKHTLLIDPRRGSWLLLGGIATTLDLSPTSAEPDAAGHCGTCTRCIDACPTGAIEPYRVDARRCLSYLTIEHEGTIAPALADRLGDRIFGCDICQEVCPFNAPHPAEPPPRIHPTYEEREVLRGGRIGLAEVLAWGEEERRTILTVSASKRASLDMLRRNAVVAGANEGLRGLVEAVAAEPSGVAGEQARLLLNRG